jgi:integrase
MQQDLHPVEGPAVAVTVTVRGQNMRELPQGMMVRNGTYYCRIWVPRDVSGLYGRQVVVTSLGTKDLRTARTRLAHRSLELEDQFESIREARKDASTAQRLASLRTQFGDFAREHALAVTEREFAYRWSFYEKATSDPSALWAGAICALPTPADFGAGDRDAFTYFDHIVSEGDLETVIGFLLRFRLRRRIREIAAMKATGNLAEVVALAKSKAPGVDAGDILVLARQLLEAELRALQSILDDQPPEPYSGDAEQSVGAPEKTLLGASTSVPSIPLDELWQRWERESDPSASTLSTWRGIVRDLKSFLGPRADDIARVEPTDIVAWKDKLLDAGKSAGTVGNGYLACARALFRYAVANKLLTADPTEGVRVSLKKKAGTSQLGYDRTEVAALLDMASRARLPWQRWLPWLAAATGSRIGEVAQLQANNVYETEGMTVVKITPAPDGGSIKNRESERVVPLHSAVIAAGFLEFVKEKGDGPLFYGRSSGNPKRKHASKGVTTRLAAWIRQNGFRDERKAPNHALRHWFKSEAARIGIPDSVADAIQGHSDSRAAAGYRHIGLEQMAEAIERIELPPRPNK